MTYLLYFICFVAGCFAPFFFLWLMTRNCSNPYDEF